MRSLRFTLAAIPVVLAALALSARTAGAQQPPATCQVVFVLDGDTINCEGNLSLRLLLVDVPDQGELGELARAYVVSLAPKGTRLALEYDANPRDSQGRWLAYVTLPDGSLLNKRLVESGFAYVEFSERNQARLSELREAERGARSQRLGIWAQ